MDKFEDFVFFDELRDELEVFDKHPDAVGEGGLLFHGLPGTGKTSFAKYLAHKHAYRTIHVDMNNTNDPFIKDGWRNGQGGWTKWFGKVAMEQFHKDAEKKYFNHALILDEWNDADRKKQNKWKVALEQMYQVETIKILIIICMNTTHDGDTGDTDDTDGKKKQKKLTKAEITDRDKNKLENLVSDAIASRCSVIEFSPYDEDMDDILDDFRKRYPKLSEKKMEKAYPDLRSLVRIGERSKRFQ